MLAKCRRDLGTIRMLEQLFGGDISHGDTIAKVKLLLFTVKPSIEH